MRGRTVIFAALALLAALVAIVYGTMDGPPAVDQAGDPGRLESEATTPSTNAGARDRLPPNARNEAPGEPRGSAAGRDAAGTTGAAPGTAPDAAQPGTGPIPPKGQR